MLTGRRPATLDQAAAGTRVQIVGAGHHGAARALLLWGLPEGTWLEVVGRDLGQAVLVRVGPRRLRVPRRLARRVQISR